MNFNSLTFLVFFIIVLGMYRLPLNWRFRKSALLIASYLFYAAWNPPFVLLLWFSTVVDWFAAAWLDRLGDDRQRERRLLLVVSLVANLGLLGFFKYGLFFLDNFVALTAALGFEFTPSRPNIILPVGISFYTFQTLSYTLDVYNRKARPANNFLDYALYVTFFPQLVAGPIVRATQFLPQTEKEYRPSPNEFGRGLFLLTLGLFQKTVLADVLMAPIAEKVFASRMTFNFYNSWTGGLAFVFQVFFDFNGYTNCAIGLAACFGFYLPRNFRFPYAAIGVGDHWQRWHISLSTWLRDYLYIPLGGNRSTETRTQVNLMLTMVIGGLWHGAAWTYVFWGGFHGVILIAERWLKKWFGGDPRWTRGYWPLLFAVLTLCLVNIADMFFRSPDMPTALKMIGSLTRFDPEGKNLKLYEILGMWIFTFFLFRQHWRWRHSTGDEILETMPAWRLILYWIVMALIIISNRGGDGNAFLYFQF